MNAVDGLSIRSERPADVGAIARITEWAFRDHPFGMHTEHHIVDALRRAGALSVSLVAETRGELIGHIAFSLVGITDGTPNWYGLGPLSVVPTAQRRGVGTVLITKGLAALRALGANGCVVLGDPRYYSRFGFAYREDCRLPGVMPGHFQTLPFGREHPSGEVTYHEAFNSGAS